MSNLERKTLLQFIDADGNEMSHAEPIADEQAREMFSLWQQGVDSYEDEKGRPVTLRMTSIQ